ncbi:MAG: 50S ribosomal protein L32 [Anaerolineae bacterium]|jgi:large subunit ribosomal protein L32
MTPLPKRRTSKARARKRRSHMALRAQSLTLCPSCRQPKLPHHACPSCGTYRGREVLEIEAES